MRTKYLYQCKNFEKIYHGNHHQYAVNHLHSAACMMLFFVGILYIGYMQLSVLLYAVGNPNIFAILPPRTSSLSSESGKTCPII